MNLRGRSDARIISLKMMGYVALVRDVLNAYKILLCKSERKRLLRRPKHQNK